MQWKLGKDYKHHMLSTELNNGGTFRIEFLVRKTAYRDGDKISKSDPIPRHILTRKVTVIIMKIDDKHVSLFHYDCGCYYREHTVCRHCYSMHDKIPTIEHFHPDCLHWHVQLMHRNKECTDVVTRNVKLIRKYKGWLIASPVMNGWACVKAFNDWNTTKNFTYVSI